MHLEAAGSPPSLGMQGFATRSRVVRCIQTAPVPSHSAGHQSLHPQQHTQPWLPSRDECSCHPGRARAGGCPPTERGDMSMTPLGEGRVSRDPHPQHRFMPAEGVPMSPMASQAGQAVGRPRSGLARAVSPAPFGGTCVHRGASRERGGSCSADSRLRHVLRTASPDHRTWLAERVEAMLLCVSLYKAPNNICLSLHRSLGET